MLSQHHPHAQELDCPGCGRGPFFRISQLMAHIESGDCTRINIAKIEEVREKKQEFGQKLEALSQRPVRGNYDKFMPSSQPGNYTTPIPWVPQKEQESAKFEEKDFPKLNGQAAAGERQNAAAILDVGKPGKQTEEPGAWAKKENLFPKAPPTQRPPEEQLKQVTGPGARQMHDSLDPDDPDHPNFNATRYFCPYSETFTCPKRGCM